LLPSLTLALVLLVSTTEPNKIQSKPENRPHLLNPSLKSGLKILIELLFMNVQDTESSGSAFKPKDYRLKTATIFKSTSFSDATPSKVGFVTLKSVSKNRSVPLKLSFFPDSFIVPVIFTDLVIP
jgi:hypothetical protein